MLASVLLPSVLASGPRAHFGGTLDDFLCIGSRADLNSRFSKLKEQYGLEPCSAESGSREQCQVQEPCHQEHDVAD